MSGVEILAGIAAAGAGISALSSIQQGQAAEDAAKFNAQLAEAEAAQTREVATVEEAKARSRFRRLAARQRAQTAAMGLELAGAPLEVMAATAAEAELDHLTIRFAGSAEEARRLNEASASKFRGRSARRAGTLRAGATLLSGASRAGQLLGVGAPDEEG